MCFIDKRKMQQYEALRHGPVPEYDAMKIRALREKLHLSRTVLAAALNTSPSTVSDEVRSRRQAAERASQKLLNLTDRKGLEDVL